MTTSTKTDLLQSCVQDLYAARGCACDGLPQVAEAAGDKLRPALLAIAQTYDEERQAFEESGHDLSGPENLWMAGVMDDARRDTRSIEPGPLLDTALIGAIRKGLAADYVSLETGIAVARSLEREDDANMLEAMHRRSGEHDRTLARLLEEIA